MLHRTAWLPAALTGMASRTGVLMEGLVFSSPQCHKSSKKTWPSRWMALKKIRTGTPVLHYYENKSKKELEEEVLLVGNVQIAVEASFGRDYKFVFSVSTTSNRLVMATASQSERDAWVQSLKQTLNQEVETSTGRARSKSSEGRVKEIFRFRLFSRGKEQRTDPSGRQSHRHNQQEPKTIQDKPLPQTDTSHDSQTHPVLGKRRSTAGKAPPPLPEPYSVHRLKKALSKQIPGQESPRIPKSDENPTNQLSPATPPSSRVNQSHYPTTGHLYHEIKELASPRVPLRRESARTTELAVQKSPVQPRRSKSNEFSDLTPNTSYVSMAPVAVKLPSTVPLTIESKRSKGELSPAILAAVCGYQIRFCVLICVIDGLGWPELKAKLQSFHLDRDRVKYKKRIGQGAFGEVWLGSVQGLTKDRPGGTLAAIKMMKDHSTDGVTKTCAERRSEDFLREAEMMSRFNHPNVVKLIGVSLTQVPYLIITEYMNKGDLKGLLRSARRSNKYWPSKVKVTCALQAARGLKYLIVEKSFVHRDVAARNILVHEDVPDELLCKVTDFGLSKDIYESDYYRFNVNEKKALLPVKWLAIESLEDQIYNHKTDVWGFGVLLWEIFTMGMMPYPGVDNLVIWPELRKGLRLSRPENCPGPIYDLILMCTALSPETRPTFEMICTRLEEEVEVCEKIQNVVYYNSPPKNSTDGKVLAQTKRDDVDTFVAKAAQLGSRKSTTDIKSMDDVHGWKREEIEDVLHSNFVSFDKSLSLEALIEKLQLLWMRRQRVAKH